MNAAEGLHRATPPNLSPTDSLYLDDQFTQKVRNPRLHVCNFETMRARSGNLNLNALSDCDEKCRRRQATDTVRSMVDASFSSARVADD
jgi:hypothetical protein